MKVKLHKAPGLKKSAKPSMEEEAPLKRSQRSDSSVSTSTNATDESIEISSRSKRQTSDEDDGNFSMPSGDDFSEVYMDDDNDTNCKQLGARILGAEKDYHAGRSRGRSDTAPNSEYDSKSKTPTATAGGFGVFGGRFAPPTPPHAFVVAAGGDAALAAARWANTLRWRHEEGIDSLLSHPTPPDTHLLKDAYCSFFRGFALPTPLSPLSEGGGGGQQVAGASRRRRRSKTRKAAAAEAAARASAKPPLLWWHCPGSPHSHLDTLWQSGDADPLALARHLLLQLEYALHQVTQDPAGKVNDKIDKKAVGSGGGGADFSLSSSSSSSAAAAPPSASKILASGASAPAPAPGKTPKGKGGGVLEQKEEGGGEEEGGQVVVVVDCEGLSLGDFVGDSLECLRLLVVAFVEHYPGVLEAVLLVNAPDWLPSALDALVKPLLPAPPTLVSSSPSSFFSSSPSPPSSPSPSPSPSDQQQKQPHLAGFLTTQVHVFSEDYASDTTFQSFVEARELGKAGEAFLRSQRSGDGGDAGGFGEERQGSGGGGGSVPSSVSPALDTLAKFLDTAEGSGGVEGELEVLACLADLATGSAEEAAFKRWLLRGDNDNNSDDGGGGSGNNNNNNNNNEEEEAAAGEEEQTSSAPTRTTQGGSKELAGELRCREGPVGEWAVKWAWLDTHARELCLSTSKPQPAGTIAGNEGSDGSAGQEGLEGEVGVQRYNVVDMSGVAVTDAEMLAHHKLIAATERGGQLDDDLDDDLDDGGGDDGHGRHFSFFCEGDMFEFEASSVRVASCWVKALKACQEGVLESLAPVRGGSAAALLHSNEYGDLGDDDDDDLGVDLDGDGEGLDMDGDETKERDQGGQSVGGEEAEQGWGIWRGGCLEAPALSYPLARVLEVRVDLSFSKQQLDEATLQAAAANSTTSLPSLLPLQKSVSPRALVVKKALPSGGGVRDGFSQSVPRPDPSSSAAKTVPRPDPLEGANKDQSTLSPKQRASPRSVARPSSPSHKPPSASALTKQQQQQSPSPQTALAALLGLKEQGFPLHLAGLSLVKRRRMRAHTNPDSSSAEASSSLDSTFPCLEVAHVERGSAGEASGAKVGDVVVSANGMTMAAGGAERLLREMGNNLAKALAGKAIANLASGNAPTSSSSSSLSGACGGGGSGGSVSSGKQGGGGNPPPPQTSVQRKRVPAPPRDRRMHSVSMSRDSLDHHNSRHQHEPRPSQQRGPGGDPPPLPGGLVGDGGGVLRTGSIRSKSHQNVLGDEGPSSFSSASSARQLSETRQKESDFPSSSPSPSSSSSSFRGRSVMARMQGNALHDPLLPKLLRLKLWRPLPVTTTVGGGGGGRAGGVDLCVSIDAETRGMHVQQAGGDSGPIVVLSASGDAAVRGMRSGDILTGVHHTPLPANATLQHVQQLMEALPRPLNLNLFRPSPYDANPLAVPVALPSFPSPLPLPSSSSSFSSSDSDSADAVARKNNGVVLEYSPNGGSSEKDHPLPLPVRMWGAVPLPEKALAALGGGGVVKKGPSAAAAGDDDGGVGGDTGSSPGPAAGGGGQPLDDDALYRGEGGFFAAIVKDHKEYLMAELHHKEDPEPTRLEELSGR